MFRVIRTTRRFRPRTEVRSAAVPRMLIAAMVVSCAVAGSLLRRPFGSPLAAADEPAAEQGSEETTGIESLTLAARQQQVAERFQRLEQLLLRLAEVEATENPERSALLRRAAKQSRDSFILDRLSAASEALGDAQYQEAIDAQQSANENLAALLKLLLTEDRSERIRNEKERIANWIKELKREERKQRAARARTENGAEFDAITEEQREILEKASELRQQMSEDDEPTEGSPEQPESEADDEGSKTENGEPQASPMNDSDAQPSDSETEASAVEQAEEELKEAEARLAEAKEKAENDEDATDDKRAETAEELKQAQQDRDAKAKALAEAKQQQSASDSESPDSPSSESESRPSESQQGPSEQGESQQEQSEQQQPQSPQQEAEKKLQSAIERMKEAQKELEDAKREEATERQRDAEKNLREAIDRLEKILRQLREEEMQRELARLEGRLRKMAQMQSNVLDQTRELAEVPVDARDRQTNLQAGNLAGEEKEIVIEADRAMLLLREEGSSVAFPEVIQQIRGDMQTVADRLVRTKIDSITQGIQEDVLAALEEMIAALQKAQRDLEEQKQQEQMPSQQQGQPGEQPLVESLAELKLIRTMQERIKKTTDRYAEMIEQRNQSVDRDFLGLLQNLADRQSRLSTITRDIALERNR